MINCIYVHIPFCEKKCNYCSFVSFSLLKYKKEYINALIKEIKHYYDNTPLKTLYFGGGTPYLLEVNELEEILNCFNINSKTEVTLELNPNNITLDKLKKIKDIGINRLSVGVQSFDDEILNSIARLHTKYDNISTIENIKKAGFENFSIDLMYGLPLQNQTIWENTLNFALKFEIPHISLYGLKIEEGTYFYHNPPKNLPSLDSQASMQEKAYEILNQNYLHYEFSNFALEEKYKSKHNLAYWKRENYFGFGLSASGFIENKRYTNTFNFKKYLKNPLIHPLETLNFNQEIEEEIFLGLRLKEGINFSKINTKYNIDIEKIFHKQFKKFLDWGYFKKTQEGICLTNKGILVSNEILCEFIDFKI